MEGVIKKPYQGVINIIRFNWHFYLCAGISVLLLLVVVNWLGNALFWPGVGLAIGIVTTTSISLLVSYYVYDRSDLFDFTWLQKINKLSAVSIVNIHAGFDETSFALKKNFPDANLNVFDFYDPIRHTELSIARARNAYPPYHSTVKISTNELPVAENSVDIIFNIFALHEVRNREERIHFLRQQARALQHDGKVVVVEHLRDVSNFLAYNIGFFHFLSAREWHRSFQQAGFSIDNAFSITPFVTVFILKRSDGNTH